MTVDNIRFMEDLLTADVSGGKQGSDLPDCSAINVRLKSAVFLSTP